MVDTAAAVAQASPTSGGADVGGGSSFNRPVLVEGAIVGERLTIEVLRKRGPYHLGTVVSVDSADPGREVPFCRHFADCGGCTWQFMDYARQLAAKQQIVETFLASLCNAAGIAPGAIVGCAATRHYRNRLDFSAANRRWIPRSAPGPAAAASTDPSANTGRALGFHVRGRFNKVLHIERCYLMPDIADTIRNALHAILTQRNVPYYDVTNKSGGFRSVVIRASSRGEVMVIVVFGGDGDPQQRNDVLDDLLTAVPTITSLYAIVNDSGNDDLRRHAARLVAGAPFITEDCGHVSLRIYPHSFYQTNSTQAVRLYNLVHALAGLHPTDVLYDLYCGIGSIGLFLTVDCAQLVGVESVPQAVQSARENAATYHETATPGQRQPLFVEAEVEQFLADLPDLVAAGRVPAPDVVVVDPPRAGLHPKALAGLRALDVRKIIYVSCRPKTQARDIAALSDRYHLAALQPIDMFPQTPHVETVAVLERVVPEP